MRTSFYVNPGTQHASLSREEAVGFVLGKISELGYQAQVYPAIAIRDVSNNHLIDGCVVEVVNDSSDEKAEENLVRLGIGLRKSMNDFPIYLLLEKKGDPVFAFRRTIFDVGLDKMARLWYESALDIQQKKGVFVQVFIHQVDERHLEINGFCQNQDDAVLWKKASSKICDELELGRPKFVDRRVLQLQEA